jgi:hypothetical protein
MLLASCIVLQLQMVDPALARRLWCQRRARGLMSASPLGPAEQCLLWNNPQPHQSPHQTSHLGHGQWQKCCEAVPSMVSGTPACWQRDLSCVHACGR